MKILVTGPCGFIGSHIVDMLVERGDRVLLLDENRSVLRLHQNREGVTRVHARCEDAPSAVGADAIIHCAGRADISNNWHPTHPNRIAMNSNCDSTVALLEGTVSRPVPFVLLSTAAVYGSRSVGLAPGERLHEELAPMSESPYAASKIAAEAWVAAYVKKLGFRGYSLRLAQVVGARYHHGHVYDFVKRYDAGEVPLKVRDDGLQKKSAVHVKDVAQACLTLIDSEAPAGAYNVTSEETWSVRDTVDVMGVEAVYADRKSAWVGDPMGLTLDPTKLAPFFKCERSVRQGVQEAVLSIRTPTGDAP